MEEGGEEIEKVEGAGAQVIAIAKQECIFADLDADVTQPAQRGQYKAGDQRSLVASRSASHAPGGKIAAGQQDQGVDQSRLGMQGSDAGTEHLFPVSPSKSHAAQQKQESQQLSQNETPHGQIAWQATLLCDVAGVGKGGFGAVHQAVLPVSRR